ncbi:MAG: hypothetical protein WEA04_03990 [Candidatus Andersenbacteria bacterium]
MDQTTPDEETQQNNGSTPPAEPETPMPDQGPQEGQGNVGA